MITKNLANQLGNFFSIMVFLLLQATSELKATENPPLNIIVLQAYPITIGAKNRSTELINKLKKQLKKIGIHKTNVTIYPWNRGLQLINQAKNTLILPIDNTKDRNTNLQWVTPLLTVNFVMVYRGKKISSIYDALNFDRILVRKNSNYEYVLRQMGFPNIVPLNSETMHLMLSASRAEAWFTSDVEATHSELLSEDLSISNTLGVQKMWIAATKDVSKDVVAALSEMNKNESLNVTLSDTERKLTIASVDNTDMQILREMSSIYLKSNPGLKIDWHLLPENLLREKITTDIISSEHEFDLITIGPYELTGWSRKNWLQSFENLPNKYDEEDIFARLRQSMSFDGEMMALPFYAETLVTYYRTDLLAKAGITMPHHPTYSEISDIASAIHNPSENIYGICLRGLPGWGQNMAIVTSIVKSFGGKWFDNKWVSKVTSQEWHDGVGLYKKLLQQFGPPNASKLGHVELTKMFSEGRCGIWIDASVFSSLVTDQKHSAIHDRVGITLAPQQKSKVNHWLWYWALAIPKNSRNLADSRNFAIWATSKEYIRLVADRYGWLKVPPGTRSSTYFDTDKKQTTFSPILKTVMESTGNYSVSMKASPNSDYQFIDIPEFQLIGSYAGNLIGKMLDGEIELNTVLREIHKKSTHIVKRSGYQ